MGSGADSDYNNTAFRILPSIGQKIAADTILTIE
jgi:hypothetical protein